MIKWAVNFIFLIEINFLCLAAWRTGNGDVSTKYQRIKLLYAEPNE